jgi:hypothetical protein
MRKLHLYKTKLIEDFQRGSNKYFYTAVNYITQYLCIFHLSLWQNLSKYLQYSCFYFLFLLHPIVCYTCILYFVQYLHGIAERTEDLVAPRGEHDVGCRVITSAASQGEECRVTPSEDEAAQEPRMCLKRATRYSLTIRHVPNTSKLKIKLGR